MSDEVIELIYSTLKSEIPTWEVEEGVHLLVSVLRELEHDT